jgi:hypothetical protein
MMTMATMPPSSEQSLTFPCVVGTEQCPAGTTMVLQTSKACIGDSCGLSVVSWTRDNTIAIATHVTEAHYLSI